MQFQPFLEVFFKNGVLKNFSKFTEMHLCQSLFLQACLENFSTEAVIRMCSAKMVFLKILQNSQVYTCARVSCLIKLQALAQHRKFQYRSSCPEVFCRNGVLKIFAKFTEIHLCQSLFFSKVAGFRPAQKILVQKQSSRGVLQKWCSVG